jgi:hypothetical protein
MRKGCFLLLATVFLIYGYQGYKIMEEYSNDAIKIKKSAKLSDIAGQVTAVPLKTSDSGAVRNVRLVRKDGDNLFLLSENRLLRFDVRGNFINPVACDIEDENDAFIVGYTLISNTNRILVIDSRRNISKYDYDGNFISKAGIGHAWHKLTAFAFHEGCLWATAETLVKDGGQPDAYLIRHDLYRLDADMNEISSMTLRIANTGRDKLFSRSCVSALFADEEGIYAYSPSYEPEHLLEDTLHIIRQKQFPLMYSGADYGTACIYPVRKGKRYFTSTCHSPGNSHLTFCYDRATHTAYLLSKGFEDDFFGTGYVADFQPVDIYNHSCCFIKSGKDLSAKFPERSADDDSPVLFVVNLNT